VTAVSTLASFATLALAIVFTVEEALADVGHAVKRVSAC
jgi:hypothetical protein